MADSELVGPLTWAVAIEWCRAVDRYTSSGMPTIPVHWGAIIDRVSAVAAGESESVGAHAQSEAHTAAPPPRAWWHGLLSFAFSSSSSSASTSAAPAPAPPRSAPPLIFAAADRAALESNYGLQCDVLYVLHLFVHSIMACESGVPTDTVTAFSAEQERNAPFLFQLDTMRSGAHFAFPPGVKFTASRLRNTCDELRRTKRWTAALEHFVALNVVNPATPLRERPQHPHLWASAYFTSWRDCLQVQTPSQRLKSAEHVIGILAFLLEQVPLIHACPNVASLPFQPHEEQWSSLKHMTWSLSMAEALQRVGPDERDKPYAPVPATLAARGLFFENNLNSQQHVSYTALSRQWDHLTKDDATLVDAAMIASVMGKRGALRHYGAPSSSSSSSTSASASQSFYDAIMFMPGDKDNQNVKLSSEVWAMPIIRFQTMTLHETLSQFWNSLRGCLWCAYCRSHHRLHWQKCPGSSPAWFDGDFRTATPTSTTAKSAPKAAGAHLFVPPMRAVPKTVQAALSHSQLLQSQHSTDPMVRSMVVNPLVQKHAAKTGVGMDMFGYGGTWCQWVFYKKQEVTGFANSDKSAQVSQAIANNLTMDKFARRQLMWTAYGSVDALWDLLIVTTLNLPAVVSLADIGASADVWEREVARDAWFTNGKIHEILQKTDNLDNLVLECSTMKRGSWLLFLQCATVLCAYTAGYESVVGYFWPPPQPDDEDLSMGGAAQADTCSTRACALQYWDPERMTFWMLCRQWRWSYMQDGGDAFYRHQHVPGKQTKVGPAIAKLLAKLEPLFPNNFARVQQTPVDATPPAWYLSSAIILYRTCFAHPH